MSEGKRRGTNRVIEILSDEETVSDNDQKFEANSGHQPRQVIDITQDDQDEVIDLTNDSEDDLIASNSDASATFRLRGGGDEAINSTDENVKEFRLRGGGHTKRTARKQTSKPRQKGTVLPMIAACKSKPPSPDLVSSDQANTSEYTLSEDESVEEFENKLHGIQLDAKEQSKTTTQNS